MERWIDYVWISGPLEAVAGEVCFNQGSAGDPSLYPSDHAGVWAELRSTAQGD